MGGSDNERLSQLQPRMVDRITIVNRAICRNAIACCYSGRFGGRPPIAPGSLVGLLYDPDDRDGLAEALRRACHMTADQRGTLKRNALAKAREWDWSRLTDRIGSFLSAASSLASVGR